MPYRKEHQSHLFSLAIVFLTVLFITPVKAQTYKECPWCPIDSIDRILERPLKGEERLQALVMAANTIKGWQSLNSVLNEMETFTEQWNSKSFNKYHILQNGVKNYLKGDLPLALKLLSKYVEEQDKENAVMGLESPLSWMRIIYWELNLIDKRLEYYNGKVDYYLKNGPYENLATCYHAIAGAYSTQGNINTAIRYYLKAAEIYKDYSEGYYANELSVVGGLYNQWGNYEKAYEYLQTGLEINRSNFDSTEFIYTSGELAIVFLKQNQPKKAIAQLDVAFEYVTPSTIRKAQYILMYHSRNLTLYAEAYMKNGMLEEAYKKLLDAKFVSDSIGLKIMGVAGYFELDYTFYKYYRLTGNNEKAEEHLLLALGKAHESKTERLIKKYQQALSLFYHSTDNPELSSTYAQKYFLLSDSIDRINNQNNIAQYEVELKENKALEEIEQLELTKKQVYRNGVIISVFFILLTLGLFSRIRYIRRSRAQIEKERNRSDQLLLNILPEEIAHELKEKGEAAARDYDLVSILFTDFKSFTQTSEKLSASDLVAEINTCFNAFDRIVEEFNIEKIKTIGDAYMAAGGLPIPKQDSVKNTLFAALKMQEFIKSHKKEKEIAGELAFEMRVGIHTGPVVAGIVGIKKFQYDVWGDTVNTASRMESNCTVGKVNISHHTYDLVKDEPEFSFVSRGKIAVKGKGEMEMYFVSRK